MNKFTYQVKNMFKSKQQKEIEARMEFNQNRHAFQKYYQELDGKIKSFSKMARDAELSGNHENAVSCAKFMTKMQKTQVRVQGLLQRFEMMYSMQQLSGVMTNFSEACAKMGFNMNNNIDLKSMWKNTAEMDMALGKLDAMSEQMDMIFDSIDNGLNLNGNSDSLSGQEDSDAEANALLDQIMGRENVLKYGAAAPAQAVSNAEASPDEAKSLDDTEERLQKMLKELKD